MATAGRSDTFHVIAVRPGTAAARALAGIVGGLAPLPEFGANVLGVRGPRATALVTALAQLAGTIILPPEPAARACDSPIRERAAIPRPRAESPVQADATLRVGNDLLLRTVRLAHTQR